MFTFFNINVVLLFMKVMHMCYNKVVVKSEKAVITFNR